MKQSALTLLILLVTMSLNGQDLARVEPEEKATPVYSKTGESEKLSEVNSTMFVSDNSKIYVNKTEKVYVWISNSNDPNAQKQLLTTHGSSMDYFYLDTEGLNTIRSPWAVDPETGEVLSPKQDVVFDVYADGVAPSTKSVFSGATKYFNEGKVYYGKGLQVNLQSYDQVSGVNKTFVSTDQNNYNDFGQPLTIQKENENSISYYSVDNVGNIEDPITKNFIVDLTEPQTSFNITGVNANNVLAANAKIILKSEDNLSQVKQIKYRIGSEGEFRNYVGPISLANIPDGDIEINFFATDNVLNEESAKSSNEVDGTNEAGEKVTSKLYVDKIAPEVDVKINGDVYEGKQTFVSERSKFELVAKDNKAGVKEILYGVSEPTSTNTFSGVFTASSKSGVQYINYSAVDNVGNKATNVSKAIYLDNKAPMTSISFDGVQVIERDSMFITSATKIKLTTVETESGVSKVNYTVNKGVSNSYADAFNLENEGNHLLTYNAIDNVNNTEETKNYSVIVDNTPPQIKYTFSFPPLGRKPIDGEEYAILPSYAKVYLAAVDQTTGVKTITYSINGGTPKEKAIIEYFKKGIFKVEVKATDILGNESSESIRFIIE